MASEMWMRLKTARKAADKTQLQLAKALGITRSGYAFLETPHDAHRTNPTITQLRTIAETTGVPLDLIVDDNADASDIVRSLLPGYVHETRPEYKTDPAVAPDEELGPMFWGAVRFACMTRGLSNQKFGATLADGPLELKVDYLGSRVISMLSTEPTPVEILRLIGLLLTAERVLGKPMSKMIIVFRRTPADVKAIGAQAKGTFGVDLRTVTSAEQAADLLAQMS